MTDSLPAFVRRARNSSEMEWLGALGRTKEGGRPFPGLLSLVILYFFHIYRSAVPLQGEDKMSSSVDPLLIEDILGAGLWGDKDEYDTVPALRQIHNQLSVYNMLREYVGTPPMLWLKEAALAVGMLMLNYITYYLKIHSLSHSLEIILLSRRLPLSRMICTIS